jgi:hypothetical protein
MKEHFVNYTQALALKELGFDEPCIARYIIPGDLVFKGCYENSNIIHLELTQNDICEAHVLAPLKSQVFKWFRDNHSINGIVSYYGKGQWNIEILDYKGNELIQIEDNTFWSYEEAESACIDKLIELIKEKKS